MVVPTGSVFGFLGPNGAGKTTAINLLLGLIEPTSGFATVLGFDTVDDAAEIRKRVGVLLDETGLYEELTAYQNLTFYARAWRIPRSRLDARIRELLTVGRLWERRHDAVGSWSTGMQQRLALARAQLHDPDLLFLDEPTAGLDVMSARAVRGDLAALADRGKTIFLTTHNMAEAEQLCANVAIINRGRLLAAGEPRALLSTQGYGVTIRGKGLNMGLAAIRERADVISCIAERGLVRLRMTTSDPSPIVSGLVAAGGFVQDVRPGTHLEDAFLRLVESDE